MQHLLVSGAVRPLKWPLGVTWLNNQSSHTQRYIQFVHILWDPTVFTENKKIMKFFSHKNARLRSIMGYIL
jgi:hypothetical protein